MDRIITDEKIKAFLEIKKIVEKLLELKQNWDTYGVTPINRKRAYESLTWLYLKIIPKYGCPLIVVPCENGELQYEWADFFSLRYRRFL